MSSPFARDILHRQARETVCAEITCPQPVIFSLLDASPEALGHFDTHLTKSILGKARARAELAPIVAASTFPNPHRLAAVVAGLSRDYSLPGMGFNVAISAKKSKALRVMFDFGHCYLTSTIRPIRFSGRISVVEMKRIQAAIIPAFLALVAKSGKHLRSVVETRHLHPPVYRPLYNGRTGNAITNARPLYK
jgi:hypothetical protein